MAEFLSRDEIRDYFVDHMSWDEQDSYSQFGDLNIVRIFNGKQFVVYNLLRRDDSPNIITVLRVTSIRIFDNSLYVEILDLKTGKTCKIGYIPEFLCGYDIFASVPSECVVSKVLKRTDQGTVIDAGLSAGLLLKHRMRPDFKAPGCMYCLGLSDFGKLFGDAGRKAFEKLEVTA